MSDSVQKSSAACRRILLFDPQREPKEDMSSQPQSQRSGEGTAGLWNYIREDDKRKDKAPDRRTNEDARQQYGRDSEQQQSSSEG